MRKYGMIPLDLVGPPPCDAILGIQSSSDQSEILIAELNLEFKSLIGGFRMLSRF